MKWMGNTAMNAGLKSPPLAGAWIEIAECSRRSGWKSPPLAGAWIEITFNVAASKAHWVAPPRGGVD